MKKNQLGPLIDRLDRVFAEAAAGSVEEVARQKADKVKKTAVKLGREFFKTLARTYMRVGAPGPFGGWADLSPRWDKRKRHHNTGAYRQIYYGIRPQLDEDRFHLRDYVRKQNLNVIFGAPQINIHTGVNMQGVYNLDGLTGSDLFKTDANGDIRFVRRTYRKDIIDGIERREALGGRYVRPEAKIRVILVPRAAGKTPSQYFDLMQKYGNSVEGSGGDDEDEGGGSSTWVERLAGNELGTALRGRVPARPLLVPFLQYWLKNDANNSIQKALRS